MASHLRIGSVLEPSFITTGNGTASNVTVTHLTATYVEVEYTWTPSNTELPPESRVTVRPWSATASFRVLED